MEGWGEHGENLLLLRDQANQDAALNGYDSSNSSNNQETITISQADVSSRAPHPVMAVVGTDWHSCPTDSLCIQRFDPSLGLITSPINPIMTSIGLAPPSALAPPPPGPPDLPVVKEIIHSQSCTLFPQNPSKT